MYKVYVSRSACYYGGISLIAANSAAEANKTIDLFKEVDIGNKCDSWGYTSVDEDDILEGVYSEKDGIICSGIYYTG